MCQLSALILECLPPNLMNNVKIYHSLYFNTHFLGDQKVMGHFYCFFKDLVARSFAVGLHNARKTCDFQILLLCVAI